MEANNSGKEQTNRKYQVHTQFVVAFIIRKNHRISNNEASRKEQYKRSMTVKLDD